MTWTIKLDVNWNSFQIANSAPPLSATESAIAPSARMRAKRKISTYFSFVCSRAFFVPCSGKVKNHDTDMRDTLLPRRVCCARLCAMPVQHLEASEQAQEDILPSKIDVTSKSPVGDISVVTLIRTDTTLDHSQKAEKVCALNQSS